MELMWEYSWSLGKRSFLTFMEGFWPLMWSGPLYLQDLDLPFLNLSMAPKKFLIPSEAFTIYQYRSGK